MSAFSHPEQRVRKLHRISRLSLQRPSYAAYPPPQTSVRQALTPFLASSLPKLFNNRGSPYDRVLERMPASRRYSQAGRHVPRSCETAAVISIPAIQYQGQPRGPQVDDAAHVYARRQFQS